MAELENKVKKSIERFKAFQAEDGYYLAFSGGKDSVVLKALADLAGVKYDAHYRLTSADPPELVRFIKEKHNDVSIDIPRYKDGTQITMWNLIPRKLIPPTRRVRYCCDQLKESGGAGRVTVTGVRWAESPSRKRNQGVARIHSKWKDNGQRVEESGGFENKSGALVLNNDNDEARRLVESCYKKTKTVVNPIVDWTDEDIWMFIHSEGISYCSLYDEGFKRLGCIGCPIARKHAREIEFARWPTYKKAYLNAFEKLLVERAKRGKQTETWGTAWDVYNWWMEYDVLPGQIDLLEDFEDEYLLHRWNR